MRQRLEYLCKKAGLPYGRTAHGVTFHWGTRRSGATDLLMKRGKKLPAVQRLGNWKKPDVLLEIYTEVTTADLLEGGRRRAGEETEEGVMSYYPTIEEDLRRAKEILAKGKSATGDGAILRRRRDAAYKLLESFVDEIERLQTDISLRDGDERERED